MFSIISVVSFALLLAGANATRKSYEGYKVLQAIPKDMDDVKYLHNLMIEDVDLDFWTEPGATGKEVDIMVAPKDVLRLGKLLTDAKIQYHVAFDNVQDLLNPMWEEIDKRDPTQHVFNINDFNTLADINGWLQDMVSQCPADVNCEVYSAGNSFLGNPINIFHMSKSGTGRRAFWLDATIHAREWIAPATILQVINHMVTQGSAQATALVDAYDWYFMPVMNPDGYAYTWTSDRMWRKNRRPNAGSTCIGADLNRNFNFRWGQDGVSFNPCSDIFCGASGGSEPETVATSAELVRLGPSLNAVVTIHSYGNMWMFPWGNTVNFAGAVCELAADHNDMMAVAVSAANAVQATYNTNWARGNSCVVIYETTGGTDDYAKGAAGVKYSFCPELRGNSFVIAATQIPLSFNEFFNGIVAMANSITTVEKQNQ